MKTNDEIKAKQSYLEIMFKAKLIASSSSKICKRKISKRQDAISTSYSFLYIFKFQKLFQINISSRESFNFRHYQQLVIVRTNHREPDLCVYSATSWENEDALSSSNLVGVSYSSMSPACQVMKIKLCINELNSLVGCTNADTNRDLKAKPYHC